MPDRIVWAGVHQQAFDRLKQLLCRAAIEPLHVIDISKPLSVTVDASEYAVGAVLSKPSEGGTAQLVAFSSCKLTPTQRNWSVIENEAYAAIWALNKFKYWIFSANLIILYSDYNPLAYLINTTPKSSKLIRWSLALQEYNVCFKYRAGRLNEAPTMISSAEDSQSITG